MMTTVIEPTTQIRPLAGGASHEPRAGGERVSLSIGGMTCAACQVRVQRVLEREPGVHTASVNLLLSPILASAAMAFSSVSVVANSLRLQRALAD